MFKNVHKEEIIIPAQMSYLQQVREFIEHIGKKNRFSDKVTNSFKLVVDEACTNIIRHGYRDVKNGQIVIRAIVRRLSLTMVVIDRGKSYDPRQVQNPDLQKYISIGKKGGLGIFMMRKLMDDIKYNVTAYGNELRLTKMRERVDRAKPLLIWDSMTLRAKFTLVTCVIMTFLAMGAYTVFHSRTAAKITREVNTSMSAQCSNLARISWEPLNSKKDITLFENAKSTRESNKDLISMVFITDTKMRPVASYPVMSRILQKPLPTGKRTLIDNMENTGIYQIVFNPDSVFYAYINPVTTPGVITAPLGYAQIWVNRKAVAQRIHNSRVNIALMLILILLVGYIGSFVLITVIMDPFHKLASWVRQVGHGTVDEDELDIDADDELGEIAQAFNEMTSKFREAQTNLMEQQRMQRELQVAQEIQQMLLPNDFPNVVGYDITSYYQAAKEVGGDLFDFVEVDDHTIGICVADVSGKGVPGSMVMTMIRTALRLEARGNKNPAEVLAKVNSFITDDIRRGMFVTAFYIILDSRERMISFASAGHNPMILYRGKTRETFYLNPPGFPVGITLPDIHLFDSTIKADRIRLHPDDILVAYTDGITEAMNHQRKLYGEERFLAAIRKFGDLDVVDFVKNLKEDILSFTGGYEQNDDITLVAIKENMEAVDVKIKMFEELFELADSAGITVAQACKEIGVSPSTYYKYRKIYRSGGHEYLREMLHGYTNLGLRHLSIEVKTKMYDIIREHPSYGAKRISTALMNDKYGNIEVSPYLIYEELKRAKLNTRKQREDFVARGGKRRLKPPGTPLLTLDGEVMVGGFRSDEMTSETFTFGIRVPKTGTSVKEKILSVSGKQNNNNSMQPNDQEENGSVTAEEKHEKKPLEIVNSDENENNEAVSDDIEKNESNID
ncbi:MAG TPA: HAMP domain-containing protein [Caldithrix sp.]|nr:HAMP domain-containing protein [Caldithrix sp.]